MGAGQIVGDGAKEGRTERIIKTRAKALSRHHTVVHGSANTYVSATHMQLLRDGSGTVRVVVVSNSRLVAEALAQSIPADAGIEVLGVGSDGNDAVILSRVHQPQVLVVDFDAPGPPLNLVIATVAQYSPSTRVVVLSDLQPDSEAPAGAWSLVSKSETLTGLWAKVAAVPHSRRRQNTQQRGAASSHTPGSSLLSRREIEVLELLSEGKQNKEIARILNVSTATAKRHVANIYVKLSVNSRVDALRRGVALGLVQLG